jgi:PAS domain S-box-containing protein
VLITAIAVLDWGTKPYLSLLFLYMVPIALAAAFLSRLQIVGLSALCSLLGEKFSALPPADAVARISIVAVAFIGTGLFVSELVRNRQLVLAHLSEIEEQVKYRKNAEEELQMLIESSPAAIVTTDSATRILLCNDAARHLFGASGRSLSGQPIERYLPGLPSFAQARQAHTLRTTFHTRARRETGETFLAATWVSTFETFTGSKLAAITVDLSDDLRDREDLSLEFLMKNARILAGALSHEVRNLCGALSVVRRNLARVPNLFGNADFEALGTLVEGLERIASTELQPSGESVESPVDVASVLDELAVIVGSDFAEAGIETIWRVDGALPLVYADRYGLLQAFLNVAKNARRAMEGVEQRVLTVSALVENSHVAIRIENSGPPVAEPEKLFRPFQQGADASGLGLWVSRAVVRGFRGDLRHEPRASGCCFVVVLSPIPEAD